MDPVISLASAPNRLLAVLVVYERDPLTSGAWPFLCEGLVAGPTMRDAADGRFLLEQVLIYDNSSRASVHTSRFPSGCSYVHDVANGGTAAAYHRACALAVEASIDWLLLLDQDTLIPAGFLEAAAASLARQPHRPAALVPWVLHEGKSVSPARITSTGTIAPLHHDSPIPVSHRLTAIASGSVIHVPTLAPHMPPPPDFWLDYVDHWIFSKFSSQRTSMVVFDAFLQHDLSVFNVHLLSLRRLNSILDGEAAFFSLLHARARMLYPLRLLARVCRFTWIRPELAIHTLRWIAGRLRHRT